MASEHHRSTPAGRPDRTPMSAARQAAEQYFQPSSALAPPPEAEQPAIVVVRRRLPQTPETADGPELPMTGTEAGPAAAAGPAGEAETRQARVHLVDTPAGADPSPAEPAQAPSPAPSPPRLRRRRDPQRAPVLIRHVVVSGPADGRRADASAGPVVDLAAVRLAMERLEERLDELRSMQAFDPLAQHRARGGLPL